MRYLILFVSLLTSSIASCQLLFEREWMTDLPVFVVDYELTGEGDTYMALSIYDNTPDTAAAIALKFNAFQELEWARQIKTFNDDDFGSVTMLSDGNLLFGGSLGAFFSPLLGGSLYKVDPDGNVLWSKIYPGSDDDRVEDIFELDNGDLILAIRRGVSGQPTYYLHTDPNGSIINQFTLSFDGLFVRPTSHYFDGSTIYSVSRVFDNDLGYDVLLMVAFNLDEVIWAKTIDPGIDVNSASIYPNPEGGFMIIGQLVDPESFFGGQDIWMLSTDQEGNTLWSNRFYRQNNGFSELANGFVFLNSGDMIMSSSFQVEEGLVPVFSRFGSNGDLENAIESEGSALEFLGFPQDGIIDLILLGGRTTNGGFGIGISQPNTFACGSESITVQLDELSTQTFNVQVDFGDSDLEENEEVFTVFNLDFQSTDLCTLVLDVESIQPESQSIYPNPASDYLIIEDLIPGQKINITDLTGKSILEERAKSETLRLSIDLLESGVYLISIEGLRSQRFIVY